MMGFFKDLFKSKMTAKNLKVELLKIERQRKRKIHELRILEQKKNRAIEQMKLARKQSNHLEVDYLWEEMQQMKWDSSYSKREMKILNLQGITLKRYIRGLERLEKNNDAEKIQKFLQKIRQSPLDTKLAAQQINEQEYLAELNLTLEEMGLEQEEAEWGEEDPEKNKFLQEIDAINQAESQGEYEVAFEKENTLKTDLDEEIPLP